MIRTRFELFAGLSAAIHVGAFAFALGHARHPAAAPKGASAGTATGAGAAAVAGETFEVPELQEVPTEAPGGAEPAPIEIDEPVTAPATTSDDGVSPARKRRTRTTNAPSATPGAGGAPASEPPPAYGAVGDRSAGDLVATFKRVFPIGASSDPVWDKVPIGFFADGDVTFYLEPDGSLAHATASAASTPAFRAAIARTTALLKHRLFTAKGATTRLHMVVRVTNQLVNHGAFTIDAAGSFELPSGRHVSVAIVER